MHSQSHYAYNGQGQSYANNLFLPSLRQQSQMPPLPQQTSPQAQTVPSIQSPHSGYQAPMGVMSEAPVKKMTLISRGKSVPRSSVRTDPENGQGLLETIQSHH